MFPYNQLTRSYCRKTSWHDLLWKGRRFNFVSYDKLHLNLKRHLGRFCLLTMTRNRMFNVEIGGSYLCELDCQALSLLLLLLLKKEIMDKFQYSCQMEKFSTTIQFCRCHRALQSCARCYETKLSMHVLRRLTLALPANALLKPSRA
ncbi:hypothetical protein T4D_11170 [Trichinella pseudospiralis]|uniref:Uncharacterized protein n=1 Tax=Trichinella pseudospiralis TaxID=6337 RepID=A0A0V1FVJ5_TRIPS|nr:hypothetical protein T4D_11170 [Trichinella pseudospiralis]